MKRSKEEKLMFCFAIYVLLFIGIALYPPNRNVFVERVPIFETLYRSNLLYPFIANTMLTIYFAFQKKS